MLMKKLPTAIAKFPFASPLKKFASIVLIGTATSVHAEIVAGESFVGYLPDVSLLNQPATGTGLTGNWGGSQYYRAQDFGLTMNGVYSTGRQPVLPLVDCRRQWWQNGLRRIHESALRRNLLFRKLPLHILLLRYKTPDRGCRGHRGLDG